MSKAVLVMDMPEKCLECSFCRGLNVCKIKKYFEEKGLISIYTVDKQIMENSKPNWCPLRELPEKVELDKMRQKSIEADCCDEEYGIDEVYLQGTVKGWNACIDAIIGDAK